MALTDYGTALVTGATSGIGRATVRALTGRGLTVHAAGRRADRLASLADETGAIGHVIDLAETDKIHPAFGDLGIDILVNNAGLGRGSGGVLRSSPADIDQTLGINVLSAAHVIRAVLPGMVARDRGHVVNLGSISGLHAMASAIYGASKGAIHLLSQNLRVELAGSRVRVTEICPGRVRTEFFDHSIPDDPAAREAYTSGFEILEPEDVADAIVYALDVPWRVNVATLELLPTEQIVGGVNIVAVKSD